MATCQAFGSLMLAKQNLIGVSEGKVLGVGSGAIHDPEGKKHFKRFEKENPRAETIFL